MGGGKDSLVNKDVVDYNLLFIRVFDAVVVDRCVCLLLLLLFCHCILC